MGTDPLIWSSRSVIYGKGDTVQYEGKVYVCVTGHESAPWEWHTPGRSVNSPWKEVTISDEVQELVEEMVPKKSDGTLATGERTIPPQWSPDAVIYNQGDIVVYEGRYYQCLTDHESAPWNWHTPGRSIDSPWRDNFLQTIAQ